MGQHMNDNIANLEQNWDTADIVDIDYRLPQNSDDYSISTEYYNNFRYPVVVGFRNGTKIQLNPRYNSTLPEGLYVKRTHQININNTVMILPTEDSLEGASYNGRRFAKLYRTAAESPTLRGADKMATFTEMHQIVEDDLRLRKGLLYLHNPDIIVATPKVGLDWFHPYSESGITAFYNFRVTDINAETSSFNFNVQIIDQNNNKGSRYILFNNQIYKCPVQYGRSLKDGIYVSYNVNPEGEEPLLEGTRRTISYPLNTSNEELPFDIFLTLEEAISYSRVLKLHKETEEAEKQKELLALKESIKNAKTEYEHKLSIQKMDYDNKLRSLKSDYELKLANLRTELANEKMNAETKVKELKAEHEKVVQGLNVKLDVNIQKSATDIEKLKYEHQRYVDKMLQDNKTDKDELNRKYKEILDKETERHKQQEAKLREDYSKLERDYNEYKYRDRSRDSIQKEMQNDLEYDRRRTQYEMDRKAAKDKAANDTVKWIVSGILGVLTIVGAAIKLWPAKSK